MLTAEEVSIVKNQIAEAENLLQKKKAEFQLRCCHPTITYYHDGDGGSYYDPATYWINWDCPDCGINWMIHYKGHSTPKEHMKRMRQYPHAQDITEQKRRENYEMRQKYK